MHFRKLASIASLLAAASLAPLGAGCGQVKCGDGTHEADGECVPANQDTDNALCGPGTHLENNECIPDMPPTVCDPDSTEEDGPDPETGVITCIGTGGSCDQALPCPADQNTGRSKVCGRLFDLQTSAQIRGTDPMRLQCGEAGASTDGPCLMEIHIYDALQFAQGIIVELNHDPVELDDCGRFRINNIEHANSGFMGIGIDDAAAAPDVRRNTGIAVPVTATGSVFNGMRGYSETVATDELWSGQISHGSITDDGAFFVTFTDNNAPVSGVEILLSQSPTANDFYFDDTSPATRDLLGTTRTTTGVNGSGLVTNIGPGTPQLTGNGGEHDGCMWEENITAAPANVMFVTQRRLLNGAQDCP